MFNCKDTFEWQGNVMVICASKDFTRYDWKVERGDWERNEDDVRVILLMFMLR